MTASDGPPHWIERGLDTIMNVGGRADPTRPGVLDCPTTLGARRSDDLNPAEHSQLDQRGPNTTGRPEDQHRLARLHPGDTMQHLPRRQVVQHQGVDDSRVEGVQDCDRPLGRDEDVAGVTPRSDERGDPLPDHRLVDVRADRDHVANDIETQHPRQSPRVAALPGGDVVERHPSSLHLDEHDASTGHRHQHLLHRQSVGATRPGQRNNSHPRSHEHKLHDCLNDCLIDMFKIECGCGNRGSNRRPAARVEEGQ